MASLSDHSETTRVCVCVYVCVVEREREGEEIYH